MAADISRIMGRNGQIIERLSSTPTLLHEIVVARVAVHVDSPFSDHSASTLS